MSDLDNDLAAARAGSPEALGRLLEALRPYLAALAAKQLPAVLQPKLGASDLLQDSMQDAIRAFPQFTGQTEGELRAWLKRILTNNAINLVNHYLQTDKRQPDLEVPLNQGSDSGGAADSLAADTSSPSGKAQRREEAEMLEMALQRLPEDSRQVIILHHRENLSFEEVARRLGRTEAATRKLWVRAVKRWRQEVESLYGPP